MAFGAADPTSTSTSFSFTFLPLTPPSRFASSTATWAPRDSSTPPGPWDPDMG